MMPTDRETRTDSRPPLDQALFGGGLSSIDSEPLPPHAGLKWVRRYFTLGAWLSAVRALAFVEKIRHLPAGAPIAWPMVASAVIMAASAIGFFQTARLLREHRRSGGIMAALGCALMISNALRAPSGVDALILIAGVGGLAIIASVWKRLD